MRTRLLIAIMLAAGASALAVVGSGAAQDAPDTDHGEASNLYGDHDECPEGDVRIKAEWEERPGLVDAMRQLHEGAEDPPPMPSIDILWVAPNDPLPFLDTPERAEEEQVLVACAEVAPGDIRLVDGDALILSDDPGQAASS